MRQASKAPQRSLLPLYKLSSALHACQTSCRCKRYFPHLGLPYKMTASPFRVIRICHPNDKKINCSMCVYRCRARAFTSIRQRPGATPSRHWGNPHQPTSPRKPPHGACSMQQPRSRAVTPALPMPQLQHAARQLRKVLKAAPWHLQRRSLANLRMPAQIVQTCRLQSLHQLYNIKLYSRMHPQLPTGTGRRMSPAKSKLAAVLLVHQKQQWEPDQASVHCQIWRPCALPAMQRGPCRIGAPASATKSRIASGPAYSAGAHHSSLVLM